MKMQADEATYTANNSCKWTASTEIGGEVVYATTRRDCCRKLARELVALGVRNQRVEAYWKGQLALTFTSLHGMALLTLAESSTRGLYMGKYHDRNEEGEDGAEPEKAEEE